MAKAYSVDLRLKALNLLDKGKTVKEVVVLLKISKSSIYLWEKRKRETGFVAPVKPRRNGHGHKITDLVAFKTFVDKNQGRTVKEMAKESGNITPKTIRENGCIV